MKKLIIIFMFLLPILFLSCQNNKLSGSYINKLSNGDFIKNEFSEDGTIFTTIDIGRGTAYPIYDQRKGKYKIRNNKLTLTYPDSDHPVVYEIYFRSETSLKLIRIKSANELAKEEQKDENIYIMVNGKLEKKNDNKKPDIIEFLKE